MHHAAQRVTPHVVVRRARWFWQRLRGLIGKPPPSAGEALWLTPCRQVHTLGMRYPIDVVYLDAGGNVLLVTTLRPWRIGRLVPDAASVLELCAGEAARLGIVTGGRVVLAVS